MSLMGLVRSLAFLAIAWVIAALGLGILGTSVNSTSKETHLIARPTLQDAVAGDWTTGKDTCVVDQVTGKSQALEVPTGDRWTLLSIAPWSDSKGRSEAVGRWINPRETGFAGLGRFRLDDKKVLDHIPLEVLPTGRPCWIPDYPGAIIFPAGDGRLYRYEFLPHDTDGELTSTALIREDSRNQAGIPVPLVWRNPEPGEGDVFLSDPFWSTDSRLKDFIFVALSRKLSTAKQKAYEYQSLWWLKVSSGGDQILAAGPLTHPKEKIAKNERTIERMPTVAIDGSGTMRLVYLSHSGGLLASNLHAVELEIDSSSGVPRARAGEQFNKSRPLGYGILPAPLIVSADGKSVFASRAAEKSVRFSLTENR